MTTDNDNDNDNDNASPWATVQTTIPILPPSSQRQPYLTPRLLIRPLLATDLAALHQLRTQHEVMTWTSIGRIDANEAATAAVLAQFLPPLDTQSFNCAICLRNDDDEDDNDDGQQLIGCGGIHKLNRGEQYGWPELGYMLRKEYWGRGLATEFVKAMLEMWEALDREVGVLKIKSASSSSSSSSSLSSPGPPQPLEFTAKEVLVAIIDTDNKASRRILEKCGFEPFDDTLGEKLLALRYFPKVGQS